MLGAISPEFSCPLSIEGVVPDKERKELIQATEQECAALAERLGLRELSGFKADLRIRRVSGGGVLRVSGHIEADIVQACVVSLRDVPGRISTDFDTFFTENRDEVALGKEIEFTAEEDDAPEMIVNGMIDLGEVAAQYLSLNIDPYPRAPGVSLAAQLAATGGQSRKENPFAVLAGLVDGKEDKNK